MAVYVRLESIDLDHYRREYLGYIGGQKKVGCQVHDVPFITSLPGNDSYPSRLCTAKEDCSGRERFCCLHNGCQACICKTCYDALDDGEMLLVKPTERIPTDGSFGTMLEDSEDDHELIDTSSDDESDEEMEGLEFESCEEDHFSQCSPFQENNSDHSSVGSNCCFSDQDDVEGEAVPDQEHYEHFQIPEDLPGDSIVPVFDHSELHTGFTGIGTGTGDCDPSDSSSDGSGCRVIETTRVEHDDIDIRGNTRGIGTSVLLNKCGSMLVRRQTRLEATRRERNLMERVVSRKDVGSIPLLFLEGMIFPSLFYRLSSSSDGSVIGSLPTCLFCQHKTRKSYGVASIASHAKAWLKYPGSAVSTDPRYLSFLFDSLANGAIEGHDTRIVLSRGFECCMGPAGMRLRDKDDDLYTDGIDNRQNVHNLCAAQRYKQDTVFVTLSANQSGLFGLWFLKHYVDSGEALQNYQAFYQR